MGTDHTNVWGVVFSCFNNNNNKDNNDNSNDNNNNNNSIKITTSCVRVRCEREMITQVFVVLPFLVSTKTTTTTIIIPIIIAALIIICVRVRCERELITLTVMFGVLFFCYLTTLTITTATTK